MTSPDTVTNLVATLRLLDNSRLLPTPTQLGQKVRVSFVFETLRRRCFESLIVRRHRVKVLKFSANVKSAMQNVKILSNYITSVDKLARPPARDLA